MTIDHRQGHCIWIKNSSGPSMEPWGTPLVISVREKICPLSTTLCFLFLKKLENRFKRLPDIPFCFILKNNTIVLYFIKGLTYVEKYTTVIKYKKYAILQVEADQIVKDDELTSSPHCKKFKINFRFFPLWNMRQAACWLYDNKNLTQTESVHGKEKRALNKQSC